MGIVKGWCEFLLIRDLTDGECLLLGERWPHIDKCIRVEGSSSAGVKYFGNIMEITKYIGVVRSKPTIKVEESSLEDSYYSMLQGDSSGSEESHNTLYCKIVNEIRQWSSWKKEAYNQQFVSAHSKRLEVN